jgi:hypothetical protein
MIDDIATDTVRHVALVEVERPAKPAQSPADEAWVISGQMRMIRTGIEALLEEGKPLDMLQPTKAWRRITDQLQESGILAREIPHRSTYNRFRKRFGTRYGLR